MEVLYSESSEGFISIETLQRQPGTTPRTVGQLRVEMAMRRKAEEVKLKQAANWDVPNICCHHVDILDVGIDVDVC